MPDIVSPRTTTWTIAPAGTVTADVRRPGVVAGLGAGLAAARCRAAVAGEPGTRSVWPGWMTEPPAASRFFSTRARTVVWWLSARSHSVSPGRTAIVFHGVVLTGTTTAWGGCASAATSAKGMGGPFLGPVAWTCGGALGKGAGGALGAVVQGSGDATVSGVTCVTVAHECAYLSAKV